MPFRRLLRLLRGRSYRGGLSNKFFHSIKCTLALHLTAYYTMFVKEWSFFGWLGYEGAPLVVLMVSKICG